MLTELLTCMQDYVFALLTGYTDAPAGKDVAEPQVFNAYFPVRRCRS